MVPSLGSSVVQETPLWRGFFFLGGCAYNGADRTDTANMPIEYTVVSILLALVQVALYLLIGRGAMYILGGSAREQNFIYQLFKKGTEPLVKGTRLITPRFVVDAHVPFVTFILLIFAGLLLIQGRRAICLAQQLVCG